jgi:hypothetical protein
MEMNMFFRFLYVAVFSFSLAASLAAADLHFVLIGDTLAEDIQEGVIGDLQHADEMVQGIIRYTGMTLQKQVFSGKEATAENVLSHLKDLSTEEDDVIILYFSGHGYRTLSKGANPWPNFYFSANTSGIDLLDAAQILQEHKARFSLIIADCCNNVISEYAAPPVVRRQFKALARGEEEITKNYRKLFMEMKGQVIVSSSKAGEFSIGFPSGGCFSNAFFGIFHSFVQQMETDLLDWQTVLSYSVYHTKSHAEKYGVSQEPIYAIQ